MSDKYKREIEEILKKKGGLNPINTYEKGFWKQLMGAFSDRLRKISIIRKFKDSLSDNCFFLKI